MNTTHDTINISVRGSSRKRFAIDGDPDRVIELNTSDIGIVKRLSDTLPKLKAVEEKIAQVDSTGLTTDEGFDIEKTNVFTEDIETLHNEMKTLINEVFDENVVDKCLPRGGTLLDPVDGEMRYLVIIADLSNAYQDDLSDEMKKVAKKRESHTSKYTKKKK